MSTPLILSVIHAVISELDRRELIELTPGVSLHDFATRVAGTMSGARPYAQFSSWLSETLIKADEVEELYASNEDILDILRDVQT